MTQFSSSETLVVRVSNKALAKVERRILVLESTCDELKRINAELIEEKVALKAEVKELKVKSAADDAVLCACKALFEASGFAKFLKDAEISAAHKITILAFDTGVSPNSGVRAR